MWQVSKYQPGDLTAMVEMAKEFYGDTWLAHEEFLRWQYFANPAGEAIIRLARDRQSGNLAGQYANIPTLFQNGNHLYTGTLALNTLTKEAYQGKGIFTGLVESVNKECVNRGLSFTYAIPNPNSFPGFIKRLNFKKLGVIPLLLKPLNLKSLVKTKAGTLMAILASPLNPFFRIKDPKINYKTPDIQILELTRENILEIEPFWTRIKNKYPIMGVRNASHFKWRYFDIPLREYKLLGAKNLQSNELLGYVVGRCTDVQGITSGMIVDFLIDETHPQAGQALLSRILTYFQDQNMQLAGTLMLEHCQEFKLLKQQGFFKCPKTLEPQPFPVIYRSHSTDLNNNFLQLNNWFLTMGDYDVI
ncbi:MAG: GNAT family protein [Desulfitobacteriaceae bacterium]